MNGHIIPNTCIVVDFWKTRGHARYIHFLTHSHGDHISGLTSSWDRPVYCSYVTAVLLKKRHGVPRKLLHILPMNQSVTIPVTSSESFTVTCFDANHCPGSVMFYFQGRFGNIFYTGDFRISSQILQICQDLSKKVDLLYLDNTFCSAKCNFPTRHECFKEILDIINKHDAHRVIIGVRKLGKEQLLGRLGTTLNETITVSPEMYQLCNEIFSTDVFTTLNLCQKPTRLSTASIHLVAENLASFNKICPTIGIIPSALFSGLPEKHLNSDIFVVPYSDHSNYTELIRFVSTLRPAKVVPIVTSTKGLYHTDISDRLDMSCFNPYLYTVRPNNEGISLFNRCVSELCEPPSHAPTEAKNKRKKKLPFNAMKKKARGVIYYEDFCLNLGPDSESSECHKEISHSVSAGDLKSLEYDVVQETCQTTAKGTQTFSTEKSPLKQKADNSGKNDSKFISTLELDSPEKADFFPIKSKNEFMHVENNESDPAAHAVKESYVKKTVSTHSDRRKKGATKRSPQKRRNLTTTSEEKSTSKIVSKSDPLSPENSAVDLNRKNKTGNIGDVHNKSDHAPNLDTQNEAQITNAFIPQQMKMAAGKTLDSFPIIKKTRRSLCKENKTDRLSPKLELKSEKSQKKSVKKQHFRKLNAFAKDGDTKVSNKHDKFQQKESQIEDSKSLRKDLKNESTSKNVAFEEDELKLALTYAISSALNIFVQKEQIVGSDNGTSESSDTCTTQSNLSSQGVHLAEYGSSTHASEDVCNDWTCHEPGVSKIEAENEVVSALFKEGGIINSSLKSTTGESSSTQYSKEVKNTSTGEGESSDFKASPSVCCSVSKKHRDYEAKLILQLHGKETSVASCTKNIKVCSECYTKKFFQNTAVVDTRTCFTCDKTLHRHRRNYKLSADAFFKTDTLKK